MTPPGRAATDHVTAAWLGWGYDGPGQEDGGGHPVTGHLAGGHRAGVPGTVGARRVAGCRGGGRQEEGRVADGQRVDDRQIAAGERIRQQDGAHRDREEPRPHGLGDEWAGSRLHRSPTARITTSRTPNMKLNRVTRLARRISATERLVCSPAAFPNPAPVRCANSVLVSPAGGVSRRGAHEPTSFRESHRRQGSSWLNTPPAGPARLPPPAVLAQGEHARASVQRPSCDDARKRKVTPRALRGPGGRPR